MKLAAVRVKGQEAVVVQGEGGLLYPLDSLGIRTMMQTIARMDDLPGLAENLKTYPAVSNKDIVFLPPVPRPEKIICVGLNYSLHIQETQAEVPVSPVLFSKFSNALAAHGTEVAVTSVTSKLDYEAELVVLIGKTCKEVSLEQARSHCFGFTCGNDLSARDLQFQTSQWLLGKACDHFAPTGPWVVTAKDINPDQLDITCRVNGHLRQSGNTRDMLFSVDYLISYLSRYMTLRPGDLVFTGTPSGVGMAMPEEDRKWLRAGDVVEVSIQGIGSLINTIV